MIIQVVVKLNSKRPEGVTQGIDGTFVVRMHAKPHDGEANIKLVKMLADYFKMPKTQIMIRSGFRSRTKLVELLD